MRLLAENVRALVVREGGEVDGVYRPERNLMQFGARVFQFLGERNFAIFKRSVDEWVISDLGRKFDLRNAMAEVLFTALSPSLAPPEFGWSEISSSTSGRRPRLLLYTGVLLEDVQEDGASDDSDKEISAQPEEKTTRPWKNMGGLRIFRVFLPIGNFGFELGPGRRIVSISEGGEGGAARWNASCLIDSGKIRTSDVVLSVDGKILSDADLVSTAQTSSSSPEEERRMSEIAAVEILREEKLIWRLRVESPKVEKVASGNSSLVSVEWTTIPHARGYCLAGTDDNGKSWWPISDSSGISKSGSKCGRILPASQSRIFIESGNIVAEKKLKFALAAVFFRHGNFFTSTFSLASNLVSLSPSPSASSQPPPPAGTTAEASVSGSGGFFLVPSSFEEGYSLPELVPEEYEVTLDVDMHMEDVGLVLGVGETRSGGVEVVEVDLSASRTVIGRWMEKQKTRGTERELRKGDRIVQINEEREQGKIAKMIDSYKKPLPEPAIKKIVVKRKADRTYMDKLEIYENVGILGDARRLLNAMTRCSARNFFLYRHCGPIGLRNHLPDWLKYDPEILEERISLVQKLQPLVCSENTGVLRNALDVLKSEIGNTKTEISDVFDIAEAAYKARHEIQEKSYVRSAIKYIDRCDWRNLHEAKEVLVRAKQTKDHQSVKYLENVVRKWEKEKERQVAIAEFSKYLDPNRKFRIDPEVIELSEKDPKLKEYLGDERIEKAKHLLKLQDAQDHLKRNLTILADSGEGEESGALVVALEEGLRKVKNLGGSNPEAEEVIRKSWACTEVRRSVEFSLRTYPISSAINFRAMIKKIKDAEKFHNSTFDKVIHYVHLEYERIKSESLLRFRAAIDRTDPEAVVDCLAELSDLEVQVSPEMALKADNIIFNSKKFFAINQDLIKASARMDDPKVIMTAIQRAEKFEDESKLQLPQLPEARKALELSMALAKVEWALTHDSMVATVRTRLTECENLSSEYFLSRPMPDHFAKILAKAREMIATDDRRKRVLSPEEETKAELIKRALYCRSGDYIKLEFLRLAVKETEDTLKDTEIFQQAVEELADLKRKLLKEKL